MKKWKLYLPFLPVVILAIAAVAGWFLLPPEVVVQIGADGKPSNTMPKLAGLLVPVALAALGGSFVAAEKRRSAGVVVIVVAAAVMVLLFAWNL